MNNSSQKDGVNVDCQEISEEALQSIVGGSSDANKYSKADFKADLKKVGPGLALIAGCMATAIGLSTVEIKRLSSI